jgi:hypothetical protein
MSWLPRRRVVPVAIALVALLAFSGAALAYWTVTGAGTGTAQAAAGTSNITVVQTTVLTAMYPGDTAQTISGNFNNPNPGPVYVTTVTASISSVAKAGGAPSGTCDASDFTLTTTATVNAEVPSGNAKGAWSGPTIKFNDKGTIQDACKGATVNLSYTTP